MFSLMTLNVWNTEGPWARRAPLIRAWIDLLDPDIVALQEVLQGPGIDQLRQLTPNHPHRAFAAQAPYWNDRSLLIGVGLASKHELGAVKTIELPSEAADPRVALAADVFWLERRVPVITTHLTYKPTAARMRLAQALALSREVAIRRNEHSPVLLCGDFNDEPDSDAIRFLSGKKALEEGKSFLLDAWAQGNSQGDGMTFTRANPYLQDMLLPDRRIDYIFVGLPPTADFGRVQCCKRIADVGRDSVFPSDHFGLYVELSAHHSDKQP